MGDEEERIDFGALRASPRRYRRLVAATAARAVGPRSSPWAALTRGAWPLVAGAALVFAVALVLSPGAAPAAAEGLSAEAQSDRANQGAIPGGVDLFTAGAGAEE